MCRDSGTDATPGKGKTVLVPLTSSLYVPGTLSDTKNVLVDIGTGYYVEKSTADAEKFYNGKVETLTKNLADLEKIVAQKSQNVRIVEDGTFMRIRCYLVEEEVLTGCGLGSFETEGTSQWCAVGIAELFYRFLYLLGGTMASLDRKHSRRKFGDLYIQTKSIILTYLFHCAACVTILLYCSACCLIAPIYLCSRQVLCSSNP